MKMKFPQGNIMINGTERLKDLRFNIADDGSHRMLIKCSVIDELTEYPISLYVSDYNSPKISGIGVELDLSGVEQNSNTPFSLKATFKPFQHKWKVKAKYGNCKLNRSIYSIMELFEILIDIITIGGTENGKEEK